MREASTKRTSVSAASTAARISDVLRAGWSQSVPEEPNASPTATNTIGPVTTVRSSRRETAA